MKLKKYFFFSVLLITLALKVSSFAVHHFTHHADSEAQEQLCELCEHLVTAQELEFQGSSSQVIPVCPDFKFLHGSTGYSDVITKQNTASQLYSRPPPQLL